MLNRPRAMSFKVSPLRARLYDRVFAIAGIQGWTLVLASRGRFD